MSKNINKELFKILPELYNELMNDKYDQELINDISLAINSWIERNKKIKDPYVVWYYDGEGWYKVTEEMEQINAYRAWYKLTNYGRTQNNSRCEKYYFMGKPDIELIDRHKEEGLEEDFSI